MHAAALKVQGVVEQVCGRVAAIYALHAASCLNKGQLASLSARQRSDSCSRAPVPPASCPNIHWVGSGVHTQELWLQAHEERSSETTRLADQEGLGPLLKRMFILHSSKLMAWAVFWAAMQQPGALGWLLTCEPSASFAVKFHVRCKHCL